MKKLIGYRVYKCLTDNNGKVVHRTPIGFSKTMQGARALAVGGCGVGVLPMSIEEVYSD
jgi:hypothetical protein